MAKQDLLPGTLDLLILRVLRGQELHGFAIAERIHLLSQKILTAEEGSLYPALYRLEAKGWIASEWGLSENNRRARFYALTKSGVKQLEREQQSFERVVGAIMSVLGSPS